MSTPEKSLNENSVSQDLACRNIPAFENENLEIPTVGYVHSKLTEFSNLFNSSYRLALLNCGRAERQSLIYELVKLKKSFKLALEELGKSLRNQEYQFSCGLCNEEILINANEDFWTSLQEHEHFEELYYQFINNKLDIRPIAEEANIPTTSESESNLLTEDATTAGDSNTDSGIDQHEMEPSTSGIQQLSMSAKKGSPSDENVNSFRFNFNVAYDEEVENKIYPPTIMVAVRKYDKVKEYTVMRAGNSKGACLICHCEMNGMRITKHMIVNHVMGQKHLRAAIHPPNLEILEFFHDFWLKQEPPVQAHSVYFRPHFTPSLKCVLCGPILLSDEVVPHITSDPHRKKVMEMYEKRLNLYLLINLQVQVYGITQEQIEAKETEHKLEEAAKTNSRERRPRKNSDSDTADEAKKLASKPQGINHNIIKSIERSESTDPFDHLPNRMKEDAPFLKRISKSSGTIIRCDLCKCNIEDNVEALKSHVITSIPHLERRKKQPYKFYCEICNMKVNGENGWLNHNFRGPRHVNMAASRKARVTEYECTTCKTVIFGDELSLSRHLSVGNKGNRRERGTKLPDPVKKLFQSRGHILEHAAVMAGNGEEVVANSFTRDCCGRLELVLSEVFEDCKVYPFGSRVSGIGTNDSDLDVFVDVGGAYYGEKNQDAADQVQLIRRAVKAFHKNKEYANIVQVLTARTPILKLHHVPTKLDCDLSFKHGLSVENTKFLRFCVELQPVCQQLISLVKKWAEHIAFECITNYAFSILCIFYLQINGYLLSVEKIREINNVEPQVISGWKTIKYVLPMKETKGHIKTYERTVYELLQEFFKYYSTFDFNTYVICPLLGRVVKRSLFCDEFNGDLPPEMDAYVAQLEGDDPERFRSNSYMCIQDPFDLSHNLTKAAQQGTLTRFQTMCKLSLSHIEALK